MSKHTPKSFKGQKLNSADLKIAINRTLKNQNGVTFSPAKLLKTLKISNSKPEVLSALNQLKKEGRVKETADEMFQGINNFVAKARSFIGKVDMTRTGAAYIIIDGKESDVYVGQRDLNGAMDGDTVEVLISPKVGRRRADGRVARVVKRGREIYMGFINDDIFKLTASQLLMKTRSSEVHIARNDIAFFNHYLRQYIFGSSSLMRWY